MIEKILRYLIALVFTVMLVSMVYLVITRYVFHNAPSWCEELARFGFVYLVFLASPIAVRHGQHLHVDFISSRYKPVTKHIVSIFSNIAGVGVLVFLFVLAGKLCFEVTTLSGAMLLPLKYVYAAIPLGSACMILFCIEIISRDVKCLIDLKNNREVTE